MELEQICRDLNRQLLHCDVRGGRVSPGPDRVTRLFKAARGQKQAVYHRLARVLLWPGSVDEGFTGDSSRSSCTFMKLPPSLKRAIY